jgi:hypothetical protein
MTQINTDFNKFAFLPDDKRATDLKSLSGLYIGTYIDPTLFHKSSMTQKYPNATELSQSRRDDFFSPINFLDWRKNQKQSA